MRFLRFATLVAVLSSLLPAADTFKEVGRASKVVPNVEVKRGRNKLQLNERGAVGENDKIKTTEKGRARMVLSDGSILSVGSDSELTVKAAPEAASAGTIELSYGKVRAEVTKRMGGSAAFEVRTSTAICGVLGTTLFVDHDKKKKFSHVINISPLDSTSQVKVRSSNSGIRGEVTLNPGQGTLVYKGKAPSVPHPMAQPDRDTARAETEVP